MANEYLDKVGLTYFWGKLKAYFQEKLVSGTNIKTVNNESLLGSGNITIEGGASIPYLTCADEASTVAKTTTLVSGTLPPTLAVGQQIVVKFDHYNSATNATLEVGTYGAIPMMRYGTTAIGTWSDTSWVAGSVCSFTYDGTNWVIHSDRDEDTTYATVKAATKGLVPAPGTSTTNVVFRKTTSGASPSWGKVTNAMLNTASATPTANYVAEFDSTAHMNSTDMTTTEVDDFVDGLSVSGVSEDDFVIEQGTSDIWTYRKWNSGIAECWGNKLVTTGFGNTFGALYYGTFSVNLPSGLFTSVTSATATRGASGGSGNGLAWISLHSVTTGALGAYIIDSVAQTLTFGFSFNVKGRWK